jgi:hypothetical protein
LARLDSRPGLRGALKEFVRAVEGGGIPKRVFKSSGIDRHGDRYEPYIRLGLWHHHLSRNGDPLLILQKVGDNFDAIALTSHELYTRGDKALWLQSNMAMINWDGCEDILQEVGDYDPLPF